MRSKYTPGPWFHRASKGGWDCIKDAAGQIIAKLWLNNPHNATLIAAVPAMLETLEQIERDSSSPGIRAAARQAIDEAKGESDGALD